MKKFFTIMVLAALTLASCTEKPEEQPAESESVTKQVIGKWITTLINGDTLTCNEKIVYTFESETQGYISASLSDYSNDHPKWTNHTPSTVTMNDKKITMSGYLDKTTSFEAELVVVSISSTEMVTDSKYSIYHNGTLQSVNSGTVLWSRVTKDYSSDILGLWEGHVSSEEGSEYDDGEPHRWEYLENGDYIYYQLDQDSNWDANVNDMAMYFVDGALLCTRWQNTGEEVEHREWWEISSISNNVMNWTALRRRKDGTTYTATFSMTKVQN